MIRKIILAGLVVVLGFLAYNFFLRASGTEIGQKAPLIEGTLANGDAFSLEELRGQYVLIDFWGSWCAPCIKEFPELRSLYDQFNGVTFTDAEGFEIVSIALEKSKDRTGSIIERENLSWPYHIIDVSRIVLLSRYAQLYGVTEVPTKVLINPSGEVMGTNLSFDEMRRILRNRI